MAGAKFTTYLLVPIPAGRALREVTQAHGGDVVMELCERCWSPYLAGKQDAHLRAVTHHGPPRPSPT